MNIYTRLLPILLIILLSPLFSLYGQTETVKVDSTFENYMRSAWDDIRQSKYSDSLQNMYSEELFEYYLKNPETKTGENAFFQTFLMWGNTGKSDLVEKALESLAYDSHLWRYVISPLGNIYAKNEDLSIDAYGELLEYLSARLTHPRSKSEVLLAQLRSSAREEIPDEQAIKIARQLVEINEAEFYVTQGLGFLHEIESLNIGQKAPDFQVQTNDGHQLSLTDLEGQYVLFEFWASWCGPCIPEIPYLKNLHEKYQNDNFTIVGISMDRDKETLINFIEEREMEWIQVYEEEGWEGKLPRLFNVSGIPRMYLLDPNGNIIAKDLRGEEMVSKVESLMDKQQSK